MEEFIFMLFVGGWVSWGPEGSREKGKESHWGGKVEKEN